MILEILIVLASTLLVLLYLIKPRRPPNFPPGPPALPLMGNLHQLGTKIHLNLQAMRDTYGPVYSIYLGRTPVVVVNSISAAREALVENRDAFAGRPYPDQLPHGCQLVGCRGKNVGFGDFTPVWKTQRKIAESALRNFYGKCMEDHVTEEISKLLARFDDRVGEPFNPGPEFDLAVLNVICSLLFGEHYEENDPEFARIVDFNARFTEGLKPGQLVDVFPWLAKFPLKSVRRLQKAVAIRDDILDTKFTEHKATFNEDKVRDLTDAILKAKLDIEKNTGQSYLTEEHIKFILADCFIAGFKTTATTLRWVFVYLLNNPHVQSRIHEGLASYATPPGLNDRPALPYLRAMLREVLRRGSPVPIPIPHRVTADTKLCGYDIPKDTTVFVNLWGINNDPDCWNEPSKFDPQRFMDEAGNYVPPSSMSYLPFSAGRRVCLGESLSNAILYLFVSSLLHKFTFEVPNNCEPPDTDEVATAVLEPKPYEIVLRSKKTQ